MTSALIGYTGFVGGYLASATPFDVNVNRSNVDVLRGRHFSRIVCAGLPAAKWIANREPEADRANVERLCDVLSSVTAGRFVLISTIDVYPRTIGGDEDTDCASEPNHAYGANRLRFEHFVRSRYPDANIVRLPALFGPGLKKNVVFDLLHDNGLDATNPHSEFQWYPLPRLPDDLEIVETHRLPLANLFTEPLATLRIVDRLFADKRVGAKAGPTVRYDVRTKHAPLFGGRDGYVMDADAVLDAISEFVAEERACL